METIYGIQADTDTLREAHEHQRRMQQQLQEQQSSVSESQATAKKTGLSTLKPAATEMAKPTPIARSTSTSALPPSTTMHHGLNAAGSTSVTGYSTACSTGASGGTDTGYSSPYFAGSVANSPFLTAADHHHSNSPGPAQLRSTTHSPALFSKFYDVEHRLPWLSLPGTVGSPALGASAGSGSTEGPKSMFGRRRSDVGVPSSGRSTPSGPDQGSPSLLASKLGQDGSSSQQEASFPQPPQPQPQAQAHHHHHHAQHLLGPQEVAALSRHNSPMPLNEALPHYLRKKSADSMHSMERSFSNPGTNSLHPPPHTGSPFMLPLGSTTTNAGSHAGGSVGQAAAAAAASPSHLLFAFPGSTSHPTTTAGTAGSPSNRHEMERASSAGVLPMMNRPSPRPQLQHNQAQSSSGTTTTTNSGPGSTSANNGIAAPSTLAAGTGSAASFFRSLTPGVHQHHTSVGLGAITGLDTSPTASHSHSGTSTPSKLFGHHANIGDRDLPSNKEVHA
ncbi:hypothetical protein EC957_009240 [Mortierella hygrophila]|uniref:Uncharacterized protein n=1 Tax=Mortierella hygrophila TaxID=979708 RepID=A0A9P6FJ75_9FUNG|nr:hypothetical protein EC957_009240 [Mortierella hygrophila]